MESAGTNPWLRTFVPLVIKNQYKRLGEQFASIRGGAGAARNPSARTEGLKKHRFQ